MYADVVALANMVRSDRRFGIYTVHSMGAADARTLGQTW